MYAVELNLKAPTHSCVWVRLTALRLRETKTFLLLMSRAVLLLELHSTFHTKQSCASDSLLFLHATQSNSLKRSQTRLWDVRLWQSPRLYQRMKTWRAQPRGALSGYNKTTGHFFRLPSDLGQHSFDLKKHTKHVTQRRVLELFKLALQPDKTILLGLDCHKLSFWRTTVTRWIWAPQVLW